MTDLELNSILRKTESGIEAIKLRDRTLTPKQRMLLIMIDGIKSVADLSNPMPNPDEARQLVGELLASGYVYESGQATAVTKPAPVRATPASKAPGVSLQEAIRRSTRLLENLLGPTCEPMCLQLEKCKTFDEFTAQVQQIQRIVAAVCSEKKAEEFTTAALGA